MRDRRLTVRAARRHQWTARLLVAATAVTTVAAQVPPPTAYAGDRPAAAAPSRQEVAGDVSQLRLLVGRSAIINALRPIARLSLTTPDVADALVTSPQQILVHGKAPGTISLLIWDKSGSIVTYEVVVERDITLLEEQVRQLFPGESIAVKVNGRDIVLAGTVSSKYVVEKAAEVASGYVEKKEQVINLLRQDEGAASNQILLRVRFAEVSRSALSELGASLFSSGYKNVLGRATTQQYPAPTFESENGGIKTLFSDFMNLFLFDLDTNLGVTIKALQAKGLFQSLAEPNLVAQNGKEASFLAGGEYPYPAIQGSGASMAITVLFKEYGIRLNFTPTVLRDDIIHLKVRPEVSALDFNNAVSVQGFRVPSLTTRRAETEVELRDGQTFAIAGLLNNTLTQTLQKVPGIGNIPILGLLFKSKALQKQESELVVMITPQILRRNSVGLTSELPRMDHPFLDRPAITIPMPPPYVPGQSPKPPASDAALLQPAPSVAPPAAPSPAISDVLTKLKSAASVRKLTKDEKRALTRLQEGEDKQQEAEDIATREAGKRAAEQAERDRKAQVAANKKANEEAERAAKVKAEQLKKANEQAERDRKVLAEQQKKAAEQAERDRKARAEAQKKTAHKQADLKKKATH